MGRSSLSFASEAGGEAIVKLLLAQRVNADSEDAFGETPLSYAAECGPHAIVKLLLQRLDMTPYLRDHVWKGYSVSGCPW